MVTADVTLNIKGSTNLPTLEAPEKPTSVVYDHCVSVYNEMSEQAREEPEGLVYEGHTTKLFAQLALATPYYTTVMDHLKAMGCVEQLRRGGGNSPSRWRLLRQPDEDAFRSIEGMNRSRSGKTAALEQQVRDLSRRVTTTETKVEALEQLVANLLTNKQKEREAT